MGYFAEDFDAAFHSIRSQRATVLRNPLQSVYFAARIAFLLMPNSVVIEIIERKLDDGGIR